jgi:hypothetical protein
MVLPAGGWGPVRDGESLFGGYLLVPLLTLTPFQRR